MRPVRYLVDVATASGSTGRYELEAGQILRVMSSDGEALVVLRAAKLEITPAIGFQVAYEQQSRGAVRLAVIVRQPSAQVSIEWSRRKRTPSKRTPAPFVIDLSNLAPDDVALDVADVSEPERRVRELVALLSIERAELFRADPIAAARCEARLMVALFGAPAGAA